MGSVDKDISQLTGSNLWKYWLIAGVICFLLSIYFARTSIGDPPGSEWEFEANNYSILWGLFFSIVAIISYAGIHDVDDSTTRKISLAFTLQLFINVAWSLFFEENNLVGLLITQLLLSASLVWMMVIFWPVSRFGFWICFVYLLSVLFESYRLAVVIHFGDLNHFRIFQRE